MDFMALLAELREAVLKDERTRLAIAGEAGIHPATFSAFMHGKRGLSIETVEQLARALNFEIKLVRLKK
jgi:transcriptional regulator with XRE-family HTH domain